MMPAIAPTSHGARAMSWMGSLFISLLTGALALVCGALVMSACASWYRISSFEGKSGYAIVGVGLLSGMAGLVIGLVAARIVAAGVSPGFFKGLGIAWAAVAIIALGALALCRLCADLAPMLDRRELEIEIQVRCPPGFQVPPPDEYGAVASVYLPGGRRQPSSALRVDELETVDDQLVVPATVPLETSASRKFLDVRFSRDHHLLFHLPLRSRPGASDLEWSRWLVSGWDAGKPEPPAEARFHARYRVRPIDPPPPEPDPEDLRAQEFAALAQEAPLEQWLPFLFEEPTEQRSSIVIQRIEQRQTELPLLIRSPEARIREHALQATAWIANPSPDLVEAVLAEGRDIADGIRRSHAMPADDPLFHDLLLELRSRFNYWKRAWWSMSQRLGVDTRPPVREIHELASQRARGTAVDEIELNARVILEALEKSSAGNGHGSPQSE